MFSKAFKVTIVIIFLLLLAVLVSGASWLGDIMPISNNTYYSGNDTHQWKGGTFVDLTVTGSLFSDYINKTINSLELWNTTGEMHEAIDNDTYFRYDKDNSSNVWSWNTTWIKDNQLVNTTAEIRAAQLFNTTGDIHEAVDNNTYFRRDSTTDLNATIDDRELWNTTQQIRDAQLFNTTEDIFAASNNGTFHRNDSSGELKSLNITDENLYIGIPEKGICFVSNCSVNMTFNGTNIIIYG